MRSGLLDWCKSPILAQVCEPAPFQWISFTPKRCFETLLSNGQRPRINRLRRQRLSVPVSSKPHWRHPSVFGCAKRPKKGRSHEECLGSGQTVLLGGLWVAKYRCSARWTALPVILIQPHNSFFDLSKYTKEKQITWSRPFQTRLKVRSSKGCI